MIELIDQKDPTRLKYRCADCERDVHSSPTRASDNFEFIATPEGPGVGKWATHICDPAAVQAVSARKAAVETHRVQVEQAAKEAAARPKAEQPAPAAPPPVVSDTPAKPKRGRPKKPVPVTEPAE